MQNLINAIKRHTDQQINNQPQPRWATVESYDSATHTIRVLLQPENVMTGWIPVGSPMAGNGFGVLMPPIPGRQCVVVPVGSASDDYIYHGMAYSQITLPPQPGGNAVQPGEIAIVSQANSWIHLLLNGDVRLSTTGNLTATVAGNMTSTVQGNLTLTTTGTSTVNSTGAIQVNGSGNITVAATGVATISGSAINLNSTTVTGGDGTQQRLATEFHVLNVFNSHQHSGVTTGGGTTGIPSVLATSTSLTSQFRAS